MTNKQTTHLGWQEEDVCDPSDEYEPIMLIKWKVSIYP